MINLDDPSGGGGTNTKSSITTGENTTIGNAIVYVGDYALDGPTSNDGPELFGNSSYNEKRGQKFTLSSSADNISDIDIYFNKTGSPTDNIDVRIETDSSGEPSGTLAHANAVGSIAGTSVNASSTQHTITFAGTFDLPAGTYHIVAERDGSLNGSNYYHSGQSDSSGGIVSVVGMLRQDGTWNSTSGHHMTFSLNGSENAYKKSNASSATKINFVGFADSTVTSGNPVNINTAGVDGNQTGLTVGAEYYLSDTPGEISTTPGTNSIKVGKAISATEIEIYTGGKIPVSGGGISDIFEAYLSTSQNFSSSTTILSLNSEVLDTGDNFDISIYKYTAPSDGIYTFTCNFKYDSANVNDYVDFFFYKNDALYRQKGSRTSINVENWSVSIILELTQGDTMDVRTRNQQGANGKVTGAIAGTSFNGYRLAD